MKSREENETKLLERWFSETTNGKIKMIEELRDTAILLTMSTPEERFVLEPTLRVLFWAMDENEKPDVRVASAMAVAKILETKHVCVACLFH